MGRPWHAWEREADRSRRLRLCERSFMSYCRSCYVPGSQPCHALVCRSGCPVQLPRLALVSILELHASVWLQQSLGKRGPHTH